MRLTWDKNSQTLAAGAAVALACGIMLGGAMRPDLGDDGRPAGPQTIVGWSGVRSTGPFDPGMSDASYSGAAPDYVLGTDWKKTMAWPDERAAVPQPAQLTATDDPQSATASDERWAEPVTRAPYQDPPPAKGRYPSMGGATPAQGADPEPARDDAPVVVSG